MYIYGASGSQLILFFIPSSSIKSQFLHSKPIQSQIPIHLLSQNKNPIHPFLPFQSTPTPFLKMPLGFPNFRHDPTTQPRYIVRPNPSSSSSSSTSSTSTTSDPSQQQQRYRDSTSKPKEGVKLSKYQYPTERGMNGVVSFDTFRGEELPIADADTKTPSRSRNPTRKSRGSLRDFEVVSGYLAWR